jgi:hypothetical protein
MRVPSYHGPTPVTDSDKKMAKIHLKLSEDLVDKKHDLLEDKIDDHKKALKDALKAGNKKSANYNKAHMTAHTHDLTDVEKDEAKIHKSLDTLGKLHTHSRKTYNDVRKASVKMMYSKSGVKVDH